MYLEHFGLKEPPFKITPVTDFFFSGANRGEILDALIYAITDGEGIIKVSGEVGSGKTMLCRMLLDKLSPNIKAIYLANPSLSRDELLYAIADRLDLNLDGERVNIILQSIQNDLEARYTRGERCVVLVDEAHAMPLATLEELRLLYNLQIGKHKLIQIVLFGQPELDVKLNQTNMRQLKDRIVHHFSLLPISRKIIESYLMFRMRAAGYKGPDIFSPAAVLMIGKSSEGLMRRVNILADKSLLAAFVEDVHKIETRHVVAAIRDSEMTNKKAWLKHFKLNRKNLLTTAGITAAALLLAGAGWLIGRQAASELNAPASVAARSQPAAPAVTTAPTPPPAAQSAVVASTPAGPALSLDSNLSLPEAPAAKPAPPVTPQAIPTGSPEKTGNADAAPLLHQRLVATRTLLNTHQDAASIQLFYTADVRPARIEGFLSRAKKLGALADIYVIPIQLGKKEGYRVVYGHYATTEQANEAINTLPKRYKEAFAPTVYLLNNLQK